MTKKASEKSVLGGMPYGGGSRNVFQYETSFWVSYTAHKCVFQKIGAPYTKSGAKPGSLLLSTLN